MLYEEKKRTSVALANMQSLVFLQLALSVFVACSAKYAFADGVEQGAVIVYHSRFLRPNNIFEITISSSYSTDVEVQAIIKGGDGDFGDAKLSISPGERRILKIQVDDLAVTNRYRLELADSLCDTAKTSELELLVNESLVLIQLDKPVYRPADIINYRVLVLNAELRLDQTVDTVDVRLLNPAEKEVDVQRNQKAKYEAYPGYFEGFFGLPNLDPDVGRWTVEVAGKHIGIATKSLSVEEYQLPLFRLDVIAPESFVVAKQANLRLTFQIINNIGIPVSGTVNVMLTDSLNSQPKQLGFAKIDGSITKDYELSLSQLEAEYCQMKKNTKPFVTLTITATETLFRKSVEVRKDFVFYCNAFKVVAAIPQEFFQPAAWNNATVKVMTHEGHKVFFRTRNIWTQGQFAGKEVTHDTEHEDDRSSDFVIGKIVAVDEDTVIVPFKSSSAATLVTLSVNIGEVREEITFYARGGHAELHMNEPGRKYRVGNDVKFSLQCTQNCKHMEYSVVSRKGILLTKNVSMTNENSGELTFMVTSDMAPASRIVAYYLKDADLYSTGGVFLVDETSTLATVHLHVTPVDRSRDHVLPGQMARIRVGAPPNSLVGFLALDKTVLQLQHGSGNDITAFEVAEKYRSWSRPAPALVDSAKCEDEQTIQQCYDEKQTAYFSKSNLAVHVLRADCPEDSSQFARVPAVQLRTNFRDSFLFITNFTDTNGFVTFRTSVPDSVTTWSITAFAANTNYSLALVKAPVELKVCQDFYISMELPASLIENESGYVNVTLFYVRDQAVAMSFNVEIGATAVFHRHLERSSLRAQHFRFPLGPFKKSVQKVTASLYLFDGAKYGLVDQIQKVVKVIHSGVVEYRNSDVINVTRGTVEIPVDNFDVEREGSVVPESSSCLLHLYADPFGMPVQDFSVEERTGPSSKFYHSSAEPVISRFMANVLFMKFLETFRPSNTVRNKPNETVAHKKKIDELIRNLRADYKNLNCFRNSNDGSYNTKGSARAAGSTWLTAYIARGLILAKSYIPVNDNLWQQSLKFLESRQNSTGNFQDYGEIADRPYRGGAVGETSLTSFVLLTFTEAGPQYSNTRNLAVRRAQIQLEFTVQGNFAKDMYGLAISCYALKRLKSSFTQHCKNQLESLATYSSGKKYWTATSTDGMQAILDAETTAYALLALHDANYGGDLSPVIGWLLSQRRNKGVFKPTQDRIMILQALTDTAAEYFNSDQSLSVEIFSDGMRLDTKIISPHDDEPKYCPLPPAANKVTLRSSGYGVGRCQVECKFNKQSRPTRQNDIIEVKASLTKSKNQGADFDLEVCIKYNDNTRNGTMMIEMSAISGFKFVKDLRYLYRMTSISNRESLRYEEGDTKAIMRISEVNSYQPICVKNDLIRVSDIINPSSRPVHVYLEENEAVDVIVEYSLIDIK